ncbi:MAG: hypothetical protein ACYSVY_11030 [Planctomycetota bacterium]|jgi:hypothetical protein
MTGVFGPETDPRTGERRKRQATAVAETTAPNPLSPQLPDVEIAPLPAAPLTPEAAEAAKAEAEAQARVDDWFKQASSLAPGQTLPEVSISGAPGPITEGPPISDEAFARAVHEHRQLDFKIVQQVAQAKPVAETLTSAQITARIAELQAQMQQGEDSFAAQQLQSQIDALRTWQSVQRLFSEENAAAIVEGVNTTGAQIASIMEQLRGDTPLHEREVLQAELDRLAEETDAFFSSVVAMGRNEDTERFLGALGATERDIDQLFALAGVFTTPETLGLPKPTVEPITRRQRYRGEKLLSLTGIPTALRQADVVNQLYEGLLASPVIPQGQKDIIRQTGAVPRVYLEMTPEELAQMGVALTGATADKLRVMQASEGEYAYWDAMLADLEPNLGFTDQLVAGVGDVVNTVGGTLRWLGADGIGQTISEMGSNLSSYVPAAEWKGVFHPNFWTKQLPRALPFTLALVPAAVGGAWAGATAAGAVTSNLLVQTIIGSTAAAGANRAVESALEAGGAYDAALSAGATPEEADRAARQTFNANMRLVGLDAFEFFTAFAPQPVRAGSKLIKTAMVAGKVVAVGISEAVEEAIQDTITRQALGLPIRLFDAEMQQAMSLGFAMGVGLGGVGDVFTSIQQKAVSNLPPDTRQKFDAEVLRLEHEEGLTSEQAEVRAWEALDPVEATGPIRDAIADTQTVETQAQSDGAGIGAIVDDQTTLAEIDMSFEGLPQPIRESLEVIGGAREAFPEFTVRNFIRYVEQHVGPIAAHSDNSEIEKVEGFLSHQQEVYSAKGSDELAKRLASERREDEEEAARLDAEIAGIEGEQAGDPVAQKTIKVGKSKKTGKELRRPLSILLWNKERSVPEYFSPRQAEQILGRPLGPDAVVRTGQHQGKVPRDVAFDEMTKEFGMTADEIAERIEYNASQRRRVKTLRERARSIVIPPGEAGVLGGPTAGDVDAFSPIAGSRPPGPVSPVEIAGEAEGIYAADEKLKVPIAEISTAELERRAKTASPYARQYRAELARRERMRAEAGQRGEVVPRGTVRHPDQVKSPEQANREIAREFYDAIPESMLDVAATVYQKTGSVEDYISQMPEYSELKLKSLSDDVRAAMAEVAEVQNQARADIQHIEEKLQQGLENAADTEIMLKAQRKLTRDIAFLDTLITDLKGGNTITVEDAIALGMAVRQTREGKLVAAVRKSGFYADQQFADYPHFADVPIVSGNFQDTIRLHESVDGGRFGGAIQKFVMWPTARTDLAQRQYVDNQKADVHALIEQAGLLGFRNRRARRAASDVLEEIRHEDATLTAEQLLDRKEVFAHVNQLFPEDQQLRIVELARQARLYYDGLLSQQNQARAKRGQAEIPYREKYLQWVLATNIWSQVGMRARTPESIMGKAPMPDYIVPDGPFNARAEARKYGLAGYTRERDLAKLMNDYAVTAGKDIFYTNIVQNAKIHTATLRSMG